ncbi:hypothetical protein AQ436_13485 [Arthrobacter sp. EpRS66]|nr:hypothetical protein AQ436_13485 [Arthrobacter sp. EpRS66]
MKPGFEDPSTSGTSAQAPESRPITAIGPRVALAGFLARDLMQVHAYISDPEVCRYSLWGPNTLAETESFIADAMIVRPGRMMTAVMMEEMVIGSAAIWRTDDTGLVGEMGYTLNQDYWGQGLATEVAGLLISIGREKLGLRRIEATCDPQNAASIRVLEKTGFALIQRRPIASQSTSRRSESLVFAVG